MIFSVVLATLALSPSRTVQGIVPAWASELRLSVDDRRVDERPTVAASFRATPARLSFSMLLPEVRANRIFSGRLGETVPRAFLDDAAKEPDRKTGETKYLIPSETRFQITSYTGDRRKITTSMEDYYIDRPEVVRSDFKREVSLLKARLGNPLEIGEGRTMGAFNLIWRWSDGTMLYLGYGAGEDDKPSYMKALAR